MLLGAFPLLLRCGSLAMESVIQLNSLIFHLVIVCVEIKGLMRLNE